MNNNSGNKTRLRSNLKNKYGTFLNDKQINGLVTKLNRKNSNNLAIKREAYSIAYQKYMIDMTNHFRRFPAAPMCPSGAKPLRFAGLGVKGVFKAVTGRTRAGVKFSKNDT
jgi:hypothetical protein|tara:strand:+ start:419 stop:751 length:333 start_codon:yes stop_codon:yes gene_type:complete